MSTLFSMFDEPPSPASQSTGRTMVWSVSALCIAIADAMDARFNPITVKGELASFSRASSGHCYFTLSDDRSQIKCAMFKRAASLLDFQPRVGDMVEIRGRLGVYEARGDLQIIVESMQEAGMGNLYEQFIRLKEMLQAEGLFDTNRKRSLSAYPQKIGVVTSLSAAALHDVCATLARRAPHVSVVISPASVQGKNAPNEIVHALQALYKLPDLEAIILTRGGGAMEDLWAFNDPQVARCIAESPIPLVSGVGHETDYTIADFCADVRAATPTAAAELVVQEKEAQLTTLKRYFSQMQHACDKHISQQQQRLDYASLQFSKPKQFLQQHQQRLQHAHTTMQSHIQRLHIVENHRLSGLKNTLQRATNRCVSKQTAALETTSAYLEMLNPMKVVNRGYAIVKNTSGNAVTSVKSIKSKETLTLTMRDGDAQVNAQ